MPNRMMLPTAKTGRISQTVKAWLDRTSSRSSRTITAVSAAMPMSDSDTRRGSFSSMARNSMVRRGKNSGMPKRERWVSRSGRRSFGRARPGGDAGIPPEEPLARRTMIVFRGLVRLPLLQFLGHEMELGHRRRRAHRGVGPLRGQPPEPHDDEHRAAQRTQYQKGQQQREPWLHWSSDVIPLDGGRRRVSQQRRDRYFEPIQIERLGQHRLARGLEERPAARAH